MYPNPATNLLTIESPISNGTLCINNLLGQEVLRQDIKDKVLQIDISKLGRGVYFVQLDFNNKGTTQIEKQAKKQMNVISTCIVTQTQDK